MIVHINGHELVVDSIFEHIEKNQFNASYNVAEGQPFPDVSFMENLRHIDSFSVTDDSGEAIPIVCDYNYVSSFMTTFTPLIRSYSMALTYKEITNEADAN